MAADARFDVGELTLGELDAAVELWRVCGLTRPWNDPYADARRALAGPTSTILAGRADARLIATAMVGADGHRAWVYYLAASPDFRRAGFGATIMRAAEAWALARGMPKIELMVRDENAAAAGFYEAIGYVHEPVRVYSRRLEPPAA
jgi:ribosomal protein S18 acetylase RimI-like enzyme